MSVRTYRCVTCGHVPLVELACPGCGRHYPRHAGGQPILIGPRSTLDVEVIQRIPVPPRVDSARAVAHWNHRLLGEALAAAPRGQLLNVAAGDGGDRPLLEGQGFDVTSTDIYASPATDVICDAHELPFADASFEVVACIASLQNFNYPRQAVDEVVRVLRPGGHYIGSVSFLEPYGGGNRFHMSHLGLRDVLERAGLRAVRVAPGWSALEAIATNFWVWNKAPPLRRLMRAVARTQYRVGMALLSGAYKLRRKPEPEHLQFAFAGSLCFDAVR